MERIRFAVIRKTRLTEEMDPKTLPGSVVRNEIARRYHIVLVQKRLDLYGNAHARDPQ
jgi:hypothetical protein